MLWLIGFGILVAVVFFAGVAKGGIPEGGAKVIMLIQWVLSILFVLVIFFVFKALFD